MIVKLCALFDSGRQGKKKKVTSEMPGINSSVFLVPGSVFSEVFSRTARHLPPASNFL